MNARLVFCARCSLLFSAAGLVIAGPTTLIAQQETKGFASDVREASGSSSPSETQNPREIAKSAVQRELEALYARQGKQTPPPMTPSEAAREIKKGSVASDGHTVIRNAQRKSIRPKPAPRSHRSAF